jgi:hypothetical protein
MAPIDVGVSSSESSGATSGLGAFNVQGGGAKVSPVMIALAILVPGAILIVLWLIFRRKGGR